MKDISLTRSTVAFLMEAILEDRIDKWDARALINPWVLGDFNADEDEWRRIEPGAFLVHGFALREIFAESAMKKGIAYEDSAEEDFNEWFYRFYEWY